MAEAFNFDQAFGKTKDFFAKHKTISIVGIVILVFLVIYMLWLLSRSYTSYFKESPYLIRGTRPGNRSKKIPSRLVKPSIDRQYGMEFTYCFWMWVDDSSFDDGNNKRWKHVLHKGGSTANPLQAPGIWLYPDENKLAINMNTFSQVKETCNVGNLPMNKWFHVCVSLMGNHMDVYINKNLKRRCKLDGVPKMNYGNVWLTMFGGFQGHLSDVQYFNRAIQYYEIERIFNRGPNETKCVESSKDTSYLSPEYWFTTGFPDSTDLD